MIIDGTNHKDLGFKIYINDFDRFSTAQSLSSVSNNNVYTNRFINRQAVTTRYTIDIPRVTQAKIDEFKRWCLKENVRFSDYDDKRECTAYKITIIDSERRVKDLYSFTLEVLKSPVYYSVETKRTENVYNKFIFNNLGTFITYPKIEFHVVRNLKMISFANSSGVFQIGDVNNVNPVLTGGTDVTINMADGSILLGGNKRIFAHADSTNLYIPVGQSEMRVKVDIDATPNIVAKYKEAYI